MVNTTVQILDGNLRVVGLVTKFYPLNEQGMLLRYSKELSDWGYCTFRISTKDPFLVQFGDILVPHQYHVRIYRGGTLVWSGAILDNTSRTKNYIEVKGVEYEWYLSRINVNPDTPDAGTSPTYNIYRVFKTGTMQTALINLIQESAANFGAGSIMGGISVGNIENPNYPDGLVLANGTALTGPWNFSDTLTLQYDIGTSVYDIIKDFGVYVKADFAVDKNLQFSFKKFLGTNRTNLVFSYGVQGNIVDYNLPRYGEKMANDIIGIATGTNGVILHVEQTDSDSINKYGKLQTTQAFTNVQDQGFLKTNANAQLDLVKTPDISASSVILNEKGYPIGQYDIGDIVTIKVKDHVIDYTAQLRAVGITVNVHNTGRELITLQTNVPDPSDLGVAT